MASYACSLLSFEATRSYGKSSPAHQEVSEMGHALPASVQPKTPYFLYAFVPAPRAGCRPLAMRTPRGVAECGNSTCSKMTDTWSLSGDEGGAVALPPPYPLKVPGSPREVMQTQGRASRFARSL